MNGTSNIFNSYSKAVNCNYQRGTSWSFRNWNCCWKREFSPSYTSPIRIEISALESISKWLKVDRKEGFSWLVRTLHPCSSQYLPSETQYPPGQTSENGLWPCLVGLPLKVLNPSFMRSLMVGIDWDSSWLIIQQPVPWWQRNVWETVCFFVERIFWSQNNWIWTESERALNTVVRDWEFYASLLLTEIVWNETGKKMNNSVNPRASTRLCHKWKDLSLFLFRFGCSWLRLAPIRL